MFYRVYVYIITRQWLNKNSWPNAHACVTVFYIITFLTLLYFFFFIYNSSNVLYPEGKVTPTKISQTVSVGKSVTFNVVTNSGIEPTLRWRHNGNDGLRNLDGQTSYIIPSVTVQHAGIYECYQSSNRASGKHAIFQLVVRGKSFSFTSFVGDFLM